jgi:hypothetical protein
MNLEFEKLVNKILTEGIGDPDAAQAVAAAHNRQVADQKYADGGRSPQDSFYNSERRAERNYGIKENPLGVIMVKWKGSKEAKPLRHPQTKEVLRYRYNNSKSKVENLKASGRYEDVYFYQTETD